MRTIPVANETRATWLRSGRIIALIGGSIVAIVAVSPPVDELVDRSFPAHMLQHAVLMNVAAPFFAIAWPLVLRIIPFGWIRQTLNTLARPAPALVIANATLWFWHIPPVYDAALEKEWLHGLEHVALLGVFILFWRPLIRDERSTGFLRTNESRILYLTLSMIAMGALAAWITLSNHVIFSFYLASATDSSALLADQRLGGTIMWLTSGLTMILAALLTLRDE